MKKKLLAVLLCVAMVAAMAVGCGGGKDSGISICICVVEYTNVQIRLLSFVFALDKKLDDMGVKYQDYDGNNNQTTQNEQIDTAIQTGANLLIVNIVTSGSNDASNFLLASSTANCIR